MANVKRYRERRKRDWRPALDGGLAERQRQVPGALGMLDEIRIANVWPAHRNQVHQAGAERNLRLLAVREAAAPDDCAGKHRAGSRKHGMVDVEFAAWTTDGRLRHPVFRGIRNDKVPSEGHGE